MKLSTIPVGAVFRIRHLRGPWRHLGHGWCALAKYAGWRDLLPIVKAWHSNDAESFRLMAEELHDVVGTSRRGWNTQAAESAFAAAFVAADKARKRLKAFSGADAFYDPRCEDSDFFRITILGIPPSADAVAATL